jgi:hypothetical protein
MLDLPPFNETMNYVDRVGSNLEKLRSIPQVPLRGPVTSIPTGAGTTGVPAVVAPVTNNYNITQSSQGSMLGNGPGWFGSDWDWDDVVSLFQPRGAPKN